MSDKRGLEFSFGWMFAIIVGAIIIFLAIYATTRLVNVENTARNSQVGQEIGTLLSPVETDLETGKVSTLSTNTNTRLYFGCKTTGNFGQEEIRTASESTVTGWEKPGLASTFYNKYIFSANVVEGKNFIIFSKPFNMPFKVSNFIYIWSDKDSYCFVDAPSKIEEELTELGFDGNNSKGINMTSSIEDCSKKSIKVCFNGGKCDINVDTLSKSVKKNTQTLYYDDTFDNSLLYAAILSDPGIYECQVGRIMKRTYELSTLYYSKANYLSTKGCTSSLQADLILYSNVTLATNSSRGVNDVATRAEELRRTNELLSCKIF